MAYYTRRDLPKLYRGYDSAPATILATGRAALASRLWVEEEWTEEEASFVTDQLMAYVQQLQNEKAGVVENG